MSSLLIRGITFVVAIPLVLLSALSVTGFRLLIAFFSGLAAWEAETMLLNLNGNRKNNNVDNDIDSDRKFRFHRIPATIAASVFGGAACTWPSLSLIAAMSSASVIVIMGSHLINGSVLGNRIRNKDDSNSKNKADVDDDEKKIVDRRRVGLDAIDLQMKKRGETGHNNNNSNDNNECFFHGNHDLRDGDRDMLASLISCALEVYIFMAIVIPFCFAGLVRFALPHGREMAWLVMLVNWQCDNGALLVGKAIGKTKLAPVLSPKKTIEGFVGGCAFGIGTALALRGPLNGVVMDFPPFLSLESTVTFALMVGITNIVGDLGMSLIKRGTSTKDTGWFFVGHGGVNDKIDGLTVALPFTYALCVFLSA